MNAENQDIRWEQRFANYQKALRKFIKAVNVVSENATGEDTSTNESIREILKKD